MATAADEIKIPVKLFVSKFPASFTEEQLREIFVPFGDIESLVILKSKDASRLQGCGFVRFTSVSDAARAIHELNGKYIVDSASGPLNVEYASGEAERLNLPSTAEGTSIKLFVGGVPLEMSDEDLRDYFSVYGQVTECHVLPQKTANPAIQTKAAFVRFARRADGEKVMETLDKKVAFPGVERTMDVRIAEGKNDAKLEDRPAYRPPMRGPSHQVHSRIPQANFNYAPPMAHIPAPPIRQPRTIGAWTEYYAPDGRPYYHNLMTGVTSWDAPVEFRVAGPPAPPSQPMYSQMAPVPASGGAGAVDAKGPAGSNLFVFHVPTEWTESDLFSQFSQFGNLISYRVAREKESNRPKGFAFVSYDNAGSASAAIAGLNGMIVGTGKRLKVSLKKGEEGTGMPPFGGFPQRAAPY